MMNLVNGMEQNQSFSLLSSKQNKGVETSGSLASNSAETTDQTIKKLQQPLFNFEAKTPETTGETACNSFSLVA